MSARRHLKLKYLVHFPMLEGNNISDISYSRLVVIMQKPFIFVFDFQNTFLVHGIWKTASFQK